MKLLPPSESEIEKKLAELVQHHGGLTRKFISPNQRGAPDRIVIWKGGVVHFVELKTKSGKLSRIQEREQNRLIKSGCAVYTLYGLEDVEQYIKVVEKLLSDEAA